MYASSKWCVVFDYVYLKLTKSLDAIFSSPEPKGQVSYCHHLASVVVVRRPSYIVNVFKNILL